MRITYIGHCGFLIETAHVTVLFDYYHGEIPALRSDLPMYICASHRHEDHFNPEIFHLPGLPAQTKYLLSYDICRGKSLSRKCPETVTMKDTGRLFSLRMEEHYTFDDLEVWTMKSTDEGVAFLVYLPEDDKLLYHCGDLNWWIWDGDTKQEYNDMTARFQREVERVRVLTEEIRERRVADAFAGIDAAFLTLDPRQEKYEFCGLDYYREHLDMRVIFPMHCWDHYEINERYARTHARLGTGTECTSDTEKGTVPQCISDAEKGTVPKCTSDAEMVPVTECTSDAEKKKDSAVIGSTEERFSRLLERSCMAVIRQRGEVYEV